MERTAKSFLNNRSQAVRLPKEFQASEWKRRKENVAKTGFRAN